MAQSYIIEGAYYRNPPFPPFNQPETYLRVYDFPFIQGQENARIGGLIMNLHPSLPVTANLTPVSDPIQSTREITVPPGGQAILSESEQALRWHINSARFPASLR